MALIAPEPPEEMVDALRRDLRRLARVPASFVPPSNLTIARGLAIREAAAELAGAVELGWRFVVTHEEGGFWVDMLGSAGAAVFDGPAVGAMLHAGRLLEDAGLDGEVCVLVSPLIAGGALWVQGEVDRCVEFSPEPSDIIRQRPDVLEEWRARAEDLARQSAGLIE